MPQARRRPIPASGVACWHALPGCAWRRSPDECGGFVAAQHQHDYPTGFPLAAIAGKPEMDCFAWRTKAVCDQGHTEGDRQFHRDLQSIASCNHRPTNPIDTDGCPPSSLKRGAFAISDRLDTIGCHASWDLPRRAHDEHSRCHAPVSVVCPLIGWPGHISN